LDGFLVNSDWSKKDGIYFFPLEIILEIFISFSEGHDARWVKDTRFHPKYEEYVVYKYPHGFDITTEIKNAMNGLIYERP